MSPIFGYAGTYASPEAPGTYRFTLDADTGVLSDPQLIYRQTNTKYSAWDKGLLATVTEADGKSGLALLDASVPGCPVLDSVLNEVTTACFLTWHDGLLYAANYHDGHVLVYTPENGRLKLLHRIYVADEAGCHMALFHGRYLMVPCLCLDQIRIFDMENDYAPVGQLDFPKGTGPRHGVFTADHKTLYLVSETTNQLFTFAVDGLKFTQTSVISILPETDCAKPMAAAIRLSSDEATLYISIRGASSITVLRTGEAKPRILQHIDAEGVDPWDLQLVPGKHFLLASNRKSNEIVSFGLNADGTVSGKISAIPVPQCVGLSLER